MFYLIETKNQLDKLTDKLNVSLTRYLEFIQGNDNTHPALAEIIAVYLEIDGEDFKNCRRDVREQGTHLYDSDGKRLSIKERYSARHFSLDKVFKSVNMTDVNEVEVPWFYDITTWQGYKKFLASDRTLVKPEEIKYNEWNQISWLGSGGESGD